MATLFIDKLAWIHIVDNKILTTRSKGKGVYYIPGGKRDPGENDPEALIREIQEELSVSLHPQSIRYMGTFKAQADGHKQEVEVKMTCYLAAYRGNLTAASEIEEMRWLSYAEKGLTSQVDHMIFDWLKDQDLLT
ncbi:MAG: NUDIX domain-containing protein [Bacteroidota bacterium]